MVRAFSELAAGAALPLADATDNKPESGFKLGVCTYSVREFQRKLSFVVVFARVWAAGGELLKNNRCLIDGGSNIIEEAGIDYILPYWMGRSYGVIAPDNLYVVGADADSEGLYAVASRDAPESFAAANSSLTFSAVGDPRSGRWGMR